MNQTNITEPALETVASADVTDATIIDEVSDVNTIKFSKFEIKMLFNPVLDGAKLNEVSKEDRVKLIKLKIKLGETAKELEAFEKTVADSFKDAKYKKLEEASTSPEATDEDKAKFAELKDKLTPKMNELLVEEYNKEIEVECEGVSEETFFGALIETDLTALGGYEYLYNKLVKK